MDFYKQLVIFELLLSLNEICVWDFFLTFDRKILPFHLMFYWFPWLLDYFVRVFFLKAVFLPAILHLQSISLCFFKILKCISEMLQECGDLSLSIRPGLIRFMMGLFYLVLYHFANSFIYDDLITSDAFYNQSFLVRVFLLGLWGKVSLYKYISCWLFTEGVCIMSGNYFSFLFRVTRSCLAIL